MTVKHERNGKRFFRAQQDPRGEWAAGVGGSAGFRSEQGVRFSQTKASTKAGTNGLPRHGAQPTRGANKAMKLAGEPRRYAGAGPMRSSNQVSFSSARLSFSNNRRVLILRGSGLNNIKSTSYNGFVVVQLRTTRWAGGMWSGIMRIERRSRNMLMLSFRDVGNASNQKKLSMMLSGAYQLKGVFSGVGQDQVAYQHGLPVKIAKVEGSDMNTRRTGRSAKAKARPSKTRGRVKRARLRRTKRRKIRVRRT